MSGVKSLQGDNSNREDDELNLKLVYRFFLRNKKIISIYSVTFFIFACIFSFFVKKTYEGQFEIVLDNPQNNQLSDLVGNQALSNFVGLGKTNSLSTEVGILESPSILMPVYEKLELKRFNKNFVAWKEKKLDVQLKKTTSILKISYRDTNKDLIIPVLREISSRYQAYSGRSEKRSNELTKTFLVNQVNLYREKSTKSFNKAQKFAIENNLGDLMPLMRNIDLIAAEKYNQENISNIPKYNSNFQTDKNSALNSPKILIPNVGIEEIRAQSANKIRNIDIQIEKIKSLGNEPNQIQYIGATIPGLVREGLPETLRQLEEEILELRTKYSENDLEVKRLLEKRRALIKLLKSRAIGYLKAERLAEESVMEAAKRPKDVLLKYKELIREAYRDETSLVSLENQLRFTDISASRLQDPWQLITVPSLLDSPVAPSKRIIALIGLIIGFFTGTILKFYSENKKGLIFEEETLESFLDKEVDIRFSYNEGNLNTYPNQIRIEEIINYNPSVIICTNNVDLDCMNKLNLFIKKQINDFKNLIKFINLDTGLSDIEKNTNIIIVTSMKDLKFDEIRTLKKRLDILNLKICSIFLIEKNL